MNIYRRWLELIVRPVRAYQKYRVLHMDLVQRHKRTGETDETAILYNNGHFDPSSSAEMIVDVAASQADETLEERSEESKRITNDQIVAVTCSIVMTILIAIMIFAVVFGDALSGTEPDGFVEVGYVLLVFWGLTLFVIVLADILYLGYVLFQAWKSKLSNPTREEARRRYVIKVTKSLLAVTLGIILTAISFHNGSRNPEVKEIHHTLPNFPSSMDGFRLVQLSDVHVGPTVGQNNIRAIVEQVNNLNPDLVVISGDLLDGPISRFRKVIEPMKNIKSIHGVYMCTGNHEYIVDVDELDEWMEWVSDLNIKPLRNERVTIFSQTNLTWSNKAGVSLFPQKTYSQGDLDLLDSLSLHLDNVTWPATSFRQEVDDRGPFTHMEGFYIAGIEDYIMRNGRNGVETDPEEAFGDRLSNRTIIALAHQPLHIDVVSSFDVDLVLSGHTHGGQVFPVHIGVLIANPYV